MIVPREINDHYTLFGKEPWEVEYNEKCSLCDTRIDEFGTCGCGAGGD